MPLCGCSLAGTEACKHCDANCSRSTSGFTEKVPIIWTNKGFSIDYKDFTDYQSLEGTWEIPPFMLKGDSNDS